MSKKNKIQDSFLEELKKIPIIQVACERVGISRNSIYRWKRDDKDFSKLMDKALAEGEELVNDMSESQLLTLIKEKNFSAIRFWLNHRSPKFKDKVEVTTKVDINDEELTQEQQDVVHKALSLASIITNVSDKQDEKTNS
ncbi:MAG: hypothetical protein HOC78_03770 [Candidatus Komeilibacteria bacterium]|jgi:hypothetical protein|nr:hypothetical protein [Candidatus Komeilibacteria bacterium]